jgi:hypothetical protein
VYRPQHPPHAAQPKHSLGRTSPPQTQVTALRLSSVLTPRAKTFAWPQPAPFGRPAKLAGPLLPHSFNAKRSDRLSQPQPSHSPLSTPVQRAQVIPSGPGLHWPAPFQGNAKIQGKTILPPYSTLKQPNTAQAKLLASAHPRFTSGRVIQCALSADEIDELVDAFQEQWDNGATDPAGDLANKIVAHVRLFKSLGRGFENFDENSDPKKIADVAFLKWPSMRGQAQFLKITSTELFNLTKGLTKEGKKTTIKEDDKDTQLMEVQSSIFGSEIFIASNYSKENDGKVLKKKLETYGLVGFTITSLVSLLHAEQQILEKLAKALRDGKAPPFVTIMGKKRPCWTCRRVLLAFREALDTHYPKTKIFFVDKTGKDTKVATLDLDGLVPKNSSEKESVKFKNFVNDYKTALGKYLKRKKLSDEVGSSGERANAPTELTDISRFATSFLLE